MVFYPYIARVNALVKHTKGWQWRKTKNKKCIQS